MSPTNPLSKLSYHKCSITVYNENAASYVTKPNYHSPSSKHKHWVYLHISSTNLYNTSPMLSVNTCKKCTIKKSSHTQTIHAACSHIHKTSKKQLTSNQYNNADGITGNNILPILFIDSNSR